MVRLKFYLKWSDNLESQRLKLERYQEKLADKYSLEKRTLDTYCHEDHEYGIVYFADDRQAGLIVLGINEKSGFRRLIGGGELASEVTDYTFRPVLTYQTKPRH